MKSTVRITMSLLLIFLLISCSKFNREPQEIRELPQRKGPPTETTNEVPHMQIDVEPVPEVYDEMFRRIYSIPGLEERNSIFSPYRALWVSEDLNYVQEKAYISGREYAHIHPDGSLHIFLEPERALEAIETGWAADHPFDLEGFVMLFTPQSFDELNVTFQLIVDGFNYVTGQEILAIDYYD